MSDIESKIDDIEEILGGPGQEPRRRVTDWAVEYRFAEGRFEALTEPQLVMPEVKASLWHGLEGFFVMNENGMQTLWSGVVGEVRIAHWFRPTSPDTSGVVVEYPDHRLFYWLESLHDVNYLLLKLEPLLSMLARQVEVVPAPPGLVFDDVGTRDNAPVLALRILRGDMSNAQPLTSSPLDAVRPRGVPIDPKLRDLISDPAVKRGRQVARGPHLRGHGEG